MVQARPFPPQPFRRTAFGALLPFKDEDGKVQLEQNRFVKGPDGPDPEFSEMKLAIFRIKTTVTNSKFGRERDGYPPYYGTAIHIGKGILLTCAHLTSAPSEYYRHPYVDTVEILAGNSPTGIIKETDIRMPCRLVGQLPTRAGPVLHDSEITLDSDLALLQLVNTFDIPKFSFPPASPEPSNDDIPSETGVIGINKATKFDQTVAFQYDPAACPNERQYNHAQTRGLCPDEVSIGLAKSDPWEDSPEPDDQFFVIHEKTIDHKFSMSEAAAGSGIMSRDGLIGLHSHGASAPIGFDSFNSGVLVDTFEFKKFLRRFNHAGILSEDWSLFANDGEALKKKAPDSARFSKVWKRFVASVNGNDGAVREDVTRGSNASFCCIS
ncbi:hypothetical protein BJ508DRAFT_372789 [Ascobolus immersus RN42]|uniref:Serine protease n=1 Tax=Ascobolus immersus RN42 TaxID=1160509 RepID=A0A3N4IM96_ASCIM|nr:hypothetical protein BJ508DRAFT_372789 [Ascobolus immersus RN42]